MTKSKEAVKDQVTTGEAESVLKDLTFSQKLFLRFLLRPPDERSRILEKLSQEAPAFQNQEETL